ncbi:hypothetical protein JOD20_003591 [Herpetosiphon giganteus]|nr:hypothetical protein [Herpetosiphon giganteus]
MQLLKFNVTGEARFRFRHLMPMLDAWLGIVRVYCPCTYVCLGAWAWLGLIRRLRLRSMAFRGLSLEDRSDSLVQRRWA